MTCPTIASYHSWLHSTSMAKPCKRWALGQNLRYIDSTYSRRAAMAISQCHLKCCHQRNGADWTQSMRWSLTGCKTSSVALSYPTGVFFMPVMDWRVWCNVHVLHQFWIFYWFGWEYVGFRLGETWLRVLNRCRRLQLFRLDARLMTSLRDSEQGRWSLVVLHIGIWIDWFW